MSSKTDGDVSGKYEASKARRGLARGVAEAASHGTSGQSGVALAWCARVRRGIEARGSRSRGRTRAERVKVSGDGRGRVPGVARTSQ
jgi:hypothetical protein